MTSDSTDASTSKASYVLHRGTFHGDFFTTQLTNIDIDQLRESDLVDTDVAQLHAAIITRVPKKRDTLRRVVTGAHYPLKYQRLKTFEPFESPEPMKSLYYGAFSSFMPTHESKDVSLSLNRSTNILGTRGKSEYLEYAASHQEAKLSSLATVDQLLERNSEILRDLVKYQQKRLLKASRHAIIPSHEEYLMKPDQYVENRQKAYKEVQEALIPSKREKECASQFLQNTADAVEAEPTSFHPKKFKVSPQPTKQESSIQYPGTLDPHLRNPVIMYED